MSVIGVYGFCFATGGGTPKIIPECMRLRVDPGRVEIHSADTTQEIYSTIKFSLLDACATIGFAGLKSNGRKQQVEVNDIRFIEQTDKDGCPLLIGRIEDHSRQVHC